MLGFIWAFLVPLIMLAVYTFVFSVVFKARWNINVDNKYQFALLLFSGLICFNIYAECISRSPTLMLECVNYIKKVIFPLEIMPVVILLSALFNAAISFVVLFVFYTIINGMPPISSILIPLALIPLLFIIIGLSWFLSSIGVYMRDITQFISIVITISMFSSPIFFPITAIPERFRYFLYLNPLTIPIEQIRSLLFSTPAIDPRVIGICFGTSWIIAWFGYIWFMKTKKGFADVI
jgi:lipopolysaccharide transport system permease protein